MTTTSRRSVLQCLHDFFEIVVAHHEMDRQGLGRRALDDAENDDTQVPVVFLLHEVVGEIDDVAHAAQAHDEFMDALACLVVEIGVRQGFAQALQHRCCLEIGLQFVLLASDGPSIGARVTQIVCDCRQVTAYDLQILPQAGAQILPNYNAGTVPGQDADAGSCATLLRGGGICRCAWILAIPGPAARFFARIRPFKKGLLAQLVEQWTLNPTVASSNLARPTKYQELGTVSPPQSSDCAIFVSITLA